MAESNPAHTLAEWVDRIVQRSARVGIVGMGYVGLPLALLMSEDGFAVTGFDIDEHKVTMLNAGGSYIHRIEPEQIQAAQAAGFHATSDFSETAAMEAMLICVPTPLYANHEPDMRAVVATIEAMTPHLHAGQLVVLESTTYPGTTEEIIAGTIARSGLAVDHDAEELGVMVAFSPEREDPGNVAIPRREIPKVVGAISSAAANAACALYGAVFHRTIMVSTPAVAEMTKLLENIYRGVNIALVNEMKQLCLHMGIDIWEVIDAAATKPFGFQAFQPGPGVGGHCIPVDPFYLSWKARQQGFETKFIELAGATNEAMPAYVVATAARALARMNIELKSARVLVLGVAYKRDVDDLRESPALTVIELLRRAGAGVSYNDPFFPTVGTGRKYDLRMSSTPLERVAEFDCVMILTDHSQYDYAKIVREAKLVIDSRNATKLIESAKIVRC